MGTAARTTIVAFAILITGCAHVSPLGIATHISDPSDTGPSDTTVDFIGGGITAQFGDFSVDAAIGRKAINCDAFGACTSTLGGMATIRWSPKR